MAYVDVADLNPGDPLPSTTTNQWSANDRFLYAIRGVHQADSPFAVRYGSGADGAIDVNVDMSISAAAGKQYTTITVRTGKTLTITGDADGDCNVACSVALILEGTGQVVFTPAAGTPGAGGAKGLTSTAGGNGTAAFGAGAGGGGSGGCHSSLGSNTASCGGNGGNCAAPVNVALLYGAGGPEHTSGGQVGNAGVVGEAARNNPGWMRHGARPGAAGGGGSGAAVGYGGSDGTSGGYGGMAGHIEAATVTLSASSKITADGGASSASAATADASGGTGGGGGGGEIVLGWGSGTDSGVTLQVNGGAAATPGDVNYDGGKGGDGAAGRSWKGVIVA